MIIDSIDNARCYRGAHPLLDAALDMLEGRMREPAAEGRMEIAGADLYLIASSGQGKKPGDARLEAHRTYVDLHLLLEGDEAIGWKPADECTRPASPYDREKDVMLFDDRPLLWLPLVPGSFAVFYPGDAHAPMVSEGVVRKVVFKIAVTPGPGS
jgi:biofilm protein TabA